MLRKSNTYESSKQIEYQYTEADMRIEVLRELDMSSTGSLTTTQLIDRLTNRLNPTGKDAKIIEGRSDTHFSQKVRNVVSHREQSTSIFRTSWAEYDSDLNGGTLTITDQGRRYIGSFSG